MIVKLIEIKKKVKKINNFFLLYGGNEGLIEETIKKVFSNDTSKKIHKYNENEILENTNNFESLIFNKSFFDENKLIIVNGSTDKILPLIKDMLEKKPEDVDIILKSKALEKKSKLRTYFEKNNYVNIVAFYDDNRQTLLTQTENYFKNQKIKISHESLNLLIERSRGNRIILNNEIEKIINYSASKKNLKLEDLIKITNLAEDYDTGEIVNQYLLKNRKKITTLINENSFSPTDNILLLKTFLYKLKRLKKIKLESNDKKNLDNILLYFKPPIFWKEKEIIKQQLKCWTLNQINLKIKKINYLELLIKKNSEISTEIINNFVLDNLN
jgi:DNA polymerase-3 subunit delta